MRSNLHLLSVSILIQVAQAFVPSSPKPILSRIQLKDENLTQEERDEALEKATKAMTAFSNKYLKNTGTKYCSDKRSATLGYKS